MHLKFVSLGGGSNPCLPVLQPMYQHDTTNWYRRYQVNYQSDLLKGGATGHIYALAEYPPPQAAFDSTEMHMKKCKKQVANLS